MLTAVTGVARVVGAVGVVLVAVDPVAELLVFPRPCHLVHRDEEHPLALGGEGTVTS